MVNSEPDKEIEKDVFCLVTSMGQKKFGVPMRNKTSDLQIPQKT